MTLIVTGLILFALLFVEEFSTQLTKNEVTPSPQVLGQKDETIVTRVVDGDTIKVSINGREETVRVLGINTPETVDPRRPVECFGKEASDKAKSILLGQSVRLESDPTQSNRDRYGRIVRYVFLVNEMDYGLEMIRLGYAYEYTYDNPYKFQADYRNAQREAEGQKIGLWGSEGCANL